MATYILPPSQVKAKIEESGFQNGDTIIVRAAPGDDTIAWGNKYRFLKYFTLICDQDPTPLPDPFGYGILGLTPKTWRARSIAPVTMTGCASPYATNSMDSFLFDFRNLNWKILDFPDWPGLGQTYRNMGYDVDANSLFYGRPGGEVGTNARAHFTDVHFEGPREFSPSADDPWGDSPLDYYLYSSDAYGKVKDWVGMSRADGANISPFIVHGTAAGRGPWPGKATELRNKRYVAEFGTDICYNPLKELPCAITMPFAAEVIMSHCSFRNLGGSYSIDPRQDGSFNVQAEKCWHENIYGDYVHVSGQARAASTEAIVEQWKYREWGTVMTGRGNCAGADLGNPHVDYRQFYGQYFNSYIPRILISNTMNDVGAQTGKPNRAGAQDIFDGGPGVCHQLKVYRHLNTGARDRAYGQSTQSPHVEGLQGLVIPKAPVPINVNSAGVYPVGANNTFTVGANSASLISRGLVKDTNVAAFVFNGGANPRLINTKLVTGTINPDNPVNVPATIAPNANVDMRCLAESYANCRQPNWPTDLVDYLNQGMSFADVSVVSIPPTMEGLVPNQTVTSAKERLHIGDFDAVAPIEIITPGLQWSTYDFIGTTQTQAFSSSPGTVKDGQHLQLRATASANAATGKDYYYKINGQQQKWTIVTAGDWKFPIAIKPATGQWQRTTTGPIITSPTTLQTQRGAVLMRFSVQKPASPLTGVPFLYGTAGRALQFQITTTDANGYSMNPQFGSYAGSRQGQIPTGKLDYDVVYELFYVADFSLPGNNCGLVIRNAQTAAIVKAWSTITTATGTIGWDYNQTANGMNLGNNIPMTLHYCAIWAGTTLTQDDGTGTQVLFDPGLQSAEAEGYRFTGFTGTPPTILLLGETAVSNRASGGVGVGGTWSTNATLTDSGGYVWANPGGIGPKLALAFDDIPSEINAGDTFPVTVKAYGSNEPLTLTPSLGSGLTMVGGPTVAMAENARTVTFQVQATGHGNKTIGVTNNVNYNNPDNLTIPVGRKITFAPRPANGFAGDPYPISFRLAPA